MACDKEVTWCGVSNCCVCVDTIVEAGTVRLDSGYSR